MLQQLGWNTLEERMTQARPIMMYKVFFTVNLQYWHQSTVLHSCRVREDIAADTAFQLGLFMPSDTASFLRQFGYRITLDFCCRHTFFHRGVHVLTGRHHADGEDFLSARFYQFCSWEFYSCFCPRARLPCMSLYDITCKRIRTLLRKKKKKKEVVVSLFFTIAATYLVFNYHNCLNCCVEKMVCRYIL